MNQVWLRWNRVVASPIPVFFTRRRLSAQDLLAWACSSSSLPCSFAIFIFDINIKLEMIVLFSFAMTTWLMLGVLASRAPSRPGRELSRAYHSLLWYPIGMIASNQLFYRRFYFRSTSTDFLQLCVTINVTVSEVNWTKAHSILFTCDRSALGDTHGTLPSITLHEPLVRHYSSYTTR